MSTSKWFYTHNGKDKPRVTLSELIELLNSGEINNKVKSSTNGFSLRITSQHIIYHLSFRPMYGTKNTVKNGHQSIRLN